MNVLRINRSRISSLALVICMTTVSATAAQAVAARLAADFDHASAGDWQKSNSSADRAFIGRLLELAAAQAWLARYALLHADSADVRRLASNEADFWGQLQSRLQSIANNLGISTALMPDLRPTRASRLVASRKNHIDDQYVRLAARANDAAMESMKRLDAAVSPRILFFIDGTLPQIRTRQSVLEQYLHPTL